MNIAMPAPPEPRGAGWEWRDALTRMIVHSRYRPHQKPVGLPDM